MLIIESLRSSREEPVAAVVDGDVLELRLGAPPPADATEGVDYHIVQPGETLSDIAWRLLGDASLADDLATLNGLGDADAIVPGQILRLR